MKFVNKIFNFYFKTTQSETLSLLGVQLGSQFLFHSGFRTKKTLRGAALDWFVHLILRKKKYFNCFFFNF